jgi:hypothetical protein
METPPVEYLRECLSYDPETGLFEWRSRPKRHFPNDGAWLAWNARFAGKRAFTTINSNGYAIGRVSYKGEGINLCVRRVAWALAHGRYPDNLVQPINGCGSDCRLTNLREVPGCNPDGSPSCRKAICPVAWRDLGNGLLRASAGGARTPTLAPSTLLKRPQRHGKLQLKKPAASS